MSSLATPEGIAELNCSLPLAVSTGRPFRFQYRVKRRDSVMRWCVCSGKAVRDDRGQVASWACSIADVNDLVEAQQQSLRVREHVNAVVAGGGLLLLSADRDGVITLREGSMNTMHCLTDVTADGALPGVGQKLEIRDEALREARRAILAGEQASSFIKTEGYDVHGKRIIGRFRLAPLIDTVSSLDMRIGGFILIGCKSKDLHLRTTCTHIPSPSRHYRDARN